MIVQICIGSSCHLKGSYEIVRLLEQAVEKHGLQDDVTLAGSFCTGNCNRIGVTIQVDDETITGVTPEQFGDFFQEHILNVLKKSEG